MQILLNGESQGYDSPLTIAELLVRMELTGRRVAVELNGEIAPRSLHGSTVLNEGDKVEIVQAIGGG